MESQNHIHRYLQGGGEMGKTILTYDWSKSPLGPPERWEQSLLITLANILHSDFPQFLFWGKDLICFYNDAYRPSLGSSGKHPAIGKKGSEVWPEIWSDINPLIQTVLNDVKPVWFEDRLLPIYRNNRLEDVYWTFCYSPAHGDDGTVAGVLVTCIETTRQVMKRNEEAKNALARTIELEKAYERLKAGNQYLQQIIDSLNQPLQVLEPIVENGAIADFRFILTNAAYSKYANCTPEELSGKKVGDIFPGYFQTSSFHNVVKTFQTEIADSWEIHYDQDGLDLYNQMSATKLDNKIIVQFTDFTKVKTLELELLKKIEELERSNNSLEAFAKFASHDLREPVRKILMFLGRLKTKFEGVFDQNDVSTFSKIENAANRMSLLIEDLIQFALVKTEPVAKQPVDLNKSLDLVLSDLEIDIQQRQAKVKVQPLPEVIGHDRQIQQLFQNLVANALKYSKGDVPPEIDISSELKEESGKVYHVIIVNDNGIGFGQEHADQIFEVFTRLHNKDEVAGNGIGLSIVKKIVENHEGIIRVESKANQGSTFKVYLPVQKN